VSKPTDFRVAVLNFLAAGLVAAQVMTGGLLVFLTGILIGSS